MKTIKLLTPLLLAGALSACAPTRAEYDMMHTTLEGSPAIRARVIAECKKDGFSREQIESLAALMNVPERNVKPVFCNRLHGALASGRLTYEDVRSVWGTPTPNLIRIMQGR